MTTRSRATSRMPKGGVLRPLPNTTLPARQLPRTLATHDYTNMQNIGVLRFIYALYIQVTESRGLKLKCASRHVVKNLVESVLLVIL